MRMYLLKRATILLATGLLFQLAALHSGAQDKPKRPRITGIDHVRLYVKDVDKSREFYESTMGFAERGGCVQGTAACLTIFGNRRQAIAFATDNAAQMRRYLSDHAVRCEPIVREKDGSSHFRVADPEGNVVGFVQRDSLVIDDPPPLPPNQVGTRLLHAGFVVKDVSAENKFYLDLLGFKLYWYGGFKDDGVDWYEIQVPDGDNWIEYMLNIPANADHKELGVQNHFSLGVKDIHAAADQLHKNGLLKFDGPEIGRDGKWGLDAYDPDGTRVEVMEFTPAGKPCCHPYTAPHPTP
jgi:catechol 2,3-dioxygenase-like lactoylglutathione lyase family enzyme